MRGGQGDAEVWIRDTGYDSTSILVSERVLCLTGHDRGSSCRMQIENAAQPGSSRGGFYFSSCVIAHNLIFTFGIAMQQSYRFFVNDLDLGLLIDAWLALLTAECCKTEKSSKSYQIYQAVPLFKS